MATARYSPLRCHCRNSPDPLFFSDAVTNAGAALDIQTAGAATFDHRSILAGDPS
jgi:hypothetical protein